MSFLCPSFVSFLFVFIFLCSFRALFGNLRIGFPFYFVSVLDLVSTSHFFYIEIYGNYNLYFGANVLIF